MYVIKYGGGGSGDVVSKYSYLIHRNLGFLYVDLPKVRMCVW